MWEEEVEGREISRRVGRDINKAGTADIGLLIVSLLIVGQLGRGRHLDQPTAEHGLRF